MSQELAILRNDNSHFMYEQHQSSVPPNSCPFLIVRHQVEDLRRDNAILQQELRDLKNQYVP